MSPSRITYSCIYKRVFLYQYKNVCLKVESFQSWKKIWNRNLTRKFLHFLPISRAILLHIDSLWQKFKGGGCSTMSREEAGVQPHSPPQPGTWMPCPVCAPIIRSLKSRLFSAIRKGYICYTEDRIRLQLSTQCLSWNDSDTWKIAQTPKCKICLHSFIWKNSSGATVPSPVLSYGPKSQTRFNPLFSWMERQVRKTDEWWLP